MFWCCASLRTRVAMQSCVFPFTSSALSSTGHLATFFVFLLQIYFFVFCWCGSTANRIRTELRSIQRANERANTIDYIPYVRAQFNRLCGCSVRNIIFQITYQRMQRSPLFPWSMSVWLIRASICDSLSKNKWLNSTMVNASAWNLRRLSQPAFWCTAWMGETHFQNYIRKSASKSNSLNLIWN